MEVIGDAGLSRGAEGAATHLAVVVEEEEEEDEEEGEEEKEEEEEEEEVFEDARGDNAFDVGDAGGVVGGNDRSAWGTIDPSPRLREADGGETRGSGGRRHGDGHHSWGRLQRWPRRRPLLLLGGGDVSSAVAEIRGVGFSTKRVLDVDGPGAGEAEKVRQAFWFGRGVEASLYFVFFLLFLFSSSTEQQQ